MLITADRAAAAPTLRQAVSAFHGGQVSVEKGLQWAVLASSAAVGLWDFESWEAVISRAGRARSRRRCTRDVVDRPERTGVVCRLAR